MSGEANTGKVWNTLVDDPTRNRNMAIGVSKLDEGTTDHTSPSYEFASSLRVVLGEAVERALDETGSEGCLSDYDRTCAIQVALFLVAADVGAKSSVGQSAPVTSIR